MEDRHPEPSHDEVAGLREQAGLLAAELKGTLRAIRMTSGAATVEVEWQQQSAGAPPAEDVDIPTPIWTTRNAGDGILTDAEHAVVSSPIVGTFYRAPEPGADPYVAVGDLVEQGQTVGIVEAMKLMNPIAAEVSGKVTEVLVENAQPVEYEQPLLALIPSMES